MGLNGLEPSTSRLSGVRSNQLSYKPFSVDILIFLTKISTPASLPLIVQVALQSPFSSITRIAVPPICYSLHRCYRRYLLFVIGFLCTITPIKNNNYAFKYTTKFPLRQSFSKKKRAFFIKSPSLSKKYIFSPVHSIFLNAMYFSVK